MYLTLLNEEEKKLFLMLSYNLAYIDGEFSYKENELIKSYCHEMNIEYINIKRENIKTYKEIIKIIKEISNDVSKKIILFEIIGLALADGHYDKHEKEIAEYIKKEFDIEDSYIEEVENLLKEYINIQERMNKIILK